MEKIADAAKTLVDKLSGVLDVFDLSYAIAGVAGSTAIWVYLYKTSHLLEVSLPDGAWWVLAPLVVYVTGMLCHSLGRWVFSDRMVGRREAVRKEFDQCLEACAKLNKLNDSPDTSGPAPDIQKKYGELRPMWQYYVRLWQVLRSEPSAQRDVAHLNRLWARMGSYDGLCGATLIWIGVFGLLWLRQGWAAGVQSGLVWGLMLAVLTLIMCRSESQRYLRYQISDLTSSVAALRQAKAAAAATPSTTTPSSGAASPAISSTASPPP